MNLYVFLLFVAHNSTSIKAFTKLLNPEKHLLTLSSVNQLETTASDILSKIEFFRNSKEVSKCILETPTEKGIIKFKPPGFRYSQPNHVILFLMPCEKTYTAAVIEMLEAHRRICMLPSAVVLILKYFASETFIKHQCTFATTNLPDLVKYSATKYFVDLSANALSLNLLSEQLSAKYRSELARFHLLGSLKNSMETHRILYKIGTGYSVGVSVYLPYPQFFEPNKYGNDRHACHEKLLFKSINSYYCVFDVMSVTQLGLVHNLSLHLLNIRNRTEQRWAKTMFDGQYILNRKSSALESVTSNQTLTQSLFFLLYYPEQLVYCKDSVSKDYFQLNFKTWTGPLSRELWVTALVVIIVISFVPKYRKRFFAMLGMFLRQSQTHKFYKNSSRLLIVLAIIGMIMCTLYENMLVSLVVAPEIFPTFQTIKEILLAGYKILWWVRGYTTPETWYGQDLLRWGLSIQQINTSFYIYASARQPNICQKAEILEQAVAAFSYSGNVQFTIQGLERCMSSCGQKKSCYSVPDQILGLPIFWEIHGITRIWLLETLERLREGGLKDRWDQWSQYNYKLLNKFFDNYQSSLVRNNRFDQIDLSKIVAIGIVWTTLNLIAVLVFILEISLKHSETCISVLNSIYHLVL